MIKQGARILVENPHCAMAKNSTQFDETINKGEKIPKRITAGKTVF